MNTLERWLHSHMRCFIKALGYLSRNPKGTIITILILGFSFSLPTGLWTVANNLTSLIHDSSPNPKISVFYDEATDQSLIERDFYNHHLVLKAEFLSPKQNQQLLSEYLGDYDINKIAGVSDIPAATVLHLHDKITDAQAMDLLKKIRAQPYTQQAQLDTPWLQKWRALINVCMSLSVSLTIIFSLGAIFIIGGVTKHAIDSQLETISVLNFIGASKAYIRREFIYLGLCRGILSSVIAFSITQGLYVLVHNDLKVIFTDIHPGVTFNGIDLSMGLTLFIAGIFIGIIGSWLAFDQQYKHINNH